MEGLEFHKFYFDQNNKTPITMATNTTMSGVHVRILSDTSAVLSYVRLIQVCDLSKSISESVTFTSEETRVWVLQKDKKWRNVHFHRSNPSV